MNPFRHQIERFTGNPRKSVFNPRDLDELFERAEALSHLEIRTSNRNAFHLGARSAVLEISASSAPPPPPADPIESWFAIGVRGFADYFTAARVLKWVYDPVHKNMIADFGPALIPEQIPIAKQPRMRRSVDREIFYDTVGAPGVIYTITTPSGLDLDNMRQTADPQNNTQIEHAYPRYVTYSEVNQALYVDHGVQYPVPEGAQCFIRAKKTTANGTGVFLNGGQANQTEIVWQEIAERIWDTPHT